jgi:hypothetical protein
VYNPLCSSSRLHTQVCAAAMSIDRRLLFDVSRLLACSTKAGLEKAIHTCEALCRMIVPPFAVERSPCRLSMREADLALNVPCYKYIDNQTAHETQTCALSTIEASILCGDFVARAMLDDTTFFREHGEWLLLGRVTAIDSNGELLLESLKPVEQDASETLTLHPSQLWGLMIHVCVSAVTSSHLSRECHRGLQRIVPRVCGSCSRRLVQGGASPSFSICASRISAFRCGQRSIMPLRNLFTSVECVSTT